MKYYSIGYAVNDGLPEVTREDVQKRKKALRSLYAITWRKI